MRASFILRCVLLIASATAISAHPVIGGPVQASTEHQASPAQEGDHAPHRHSEGFHAYNPEYYKAEHHQEHHMRRPSYGSRRTEVASRDLAMLDVITRDLVQTASEYALRSLEDDTSLASRSLEKRHKKKKEKKPSKTEPSKPASTSDSASAPKIPSKPKKKHHVNMHKVGSVLGKIGKGLLRVFRLRDDDPELYARVFEDGEVLRVREDVMQELVLRGVLDELVY